MKLFLVILGIIPLLAAQEPAKPAVDPAKPQEEQSKTAPAEKAAEAAPAKEPAEQAITGSVDFGYRFNTGIAGNYDAYRTTVNLGEGLKLFGFDLQIKSPTHKYFDHMKLFGLGWGGDPYTTARLDVFKERVYDLHVDYKNIAYFNYLPTFANTFLDQGILHTERASDLRHKMFDAELRLRPGTRLIPYLQFSRDSTDGHGITTFVTGGNEYPVAETSHDTTLRFVGGVSLELNKVHATFEEGSTSFRDDSDTRNTQLNRGDRLTPIAGQQLNLSTLSELYRTRGDGYFTKGQATFTPYTWMDLSGQFLYSNPSTNSTYLANATGSFVDLATLVFYNSQTSGLTSLANQPHSAGSLYLELRPLAHVRILESYSGDHLNVPSSYVLSEATSIATPPNPEKGYTRYTTTYNRHQTEAVVDLTRWLTVRAGFRNVWGDLTTRAPQVNGVELENAQLSQNVFLAGLQLRLNQKFRATFDTEVGSADKSYFRTSLHDYKKGTARIRYQALSNLALTSSFTALYNENPTPGVNYDFRSRQASLGFFWNPKAAKRYSLLGDYTFSSLKTNLGYFEPQSGLSDLSNYRDNAHTATLLFDCSPPGGKYAPHFSFGGSMFKSSGSRPSSYMQPLARVSMPFHEHANFFTEWRYYGYGESNYAYEGFRSHVFQIGLRLIL